MSIIRHECTVHDSVNGKPATVVIVLEIDLDRVASDMAYHVLHGTKGTVTRVRGAIVATRKQEPEPNRAPIETLGSVDVVNPRVILESFKRQFGYGKRP